MMWGTVTKFVTKAEIINLCTKEENTWNVIVEGKAQQDIARRFVRLNNSKLFSKTRGSY